MAIVGINLTKINAEKKEAKGGKVSINNNISIKNVEEKDLSLGASKQKGLRFNFLFKCEYAPEVGSINLEGSVMFLADAVKNKAIKEGWDKGKNVAPEIMESVLNSALNRCNIEAIKISQDMNLPSPVPMPRLQRKQAKKAAK
ncbi:hypothetical protein KY306_02220 [Candidatus Woesearchaeota archaeon]|nr:hypothetical protein [Candidatus Woesearchaeota archaeon]